MQRQLTSAVRSIPWYIVGTFLFAPLLLALPTAGGSLAMYLAPYMMFTGNAKQFWGSFAIMVGPGLFLWILRQFLRAALSVYISNRVRKPVPIRYYP